MIGMVATGLAGCGGAPGMGLGTMLGNDLYWPPACDKSPCVLTGLGGIVDVWTRHVDENLALGRSFIVPEGICASACEIAARRANARIMPGAKLIAHTPRPMLTSAEEKAGEGDLFAMLGF